MHNIQRLALCYLFLTKPLYIRWREQSHKARSQPLIITRKTVEIPLLRHSECLLSLFSMLGDHRKPQPIFSFEILASHKTSHICLRVTQTDFFHCFAFHLPLGCSATLQTCCTCWSELLRTASLFHFVKSCSTKGLSKSAKAACQSPGPCEIQFLLKSLVNAVLSGSVNCPRNNAFPQPSFLRSVCPSSILLQPLIDVHW